MAGDAEDFNFTPEENTVLVSRSKELAPGSFVGRELEQDSFRELLRKMLGPQPRLFGGFRKPAAREPELVQVIKGRLVLINGPEGSGKTRLALRFREITQKEKEFSRRVAAFRLDWKELKERDQRLSSLLPGKTVFPQTFLDIIFTFFVGEDQESHFEAYRASLEETRLLAATATGPELEAVWDYRLRALGKGLYSLSGDKPVLFIQDNFSGLPGLENRLKPLMEESGSQIIWVIVGPEDPSGVVGAFNPGRVLISNLKPLPAAELQSLITLEIGRYRPETGSLAMEQNETDNFLLSPEQIKSFSAITGGWPLAARIATFLIQTGTPLSGFRQNPANLETPLVEELFEGPLGSGHPDRLKLYALALLRRPEPGLLGALLDLRQDFIPTQEVLDKIYTRYSFLFEPLRKMVFHSSVERPFRRWLLQPAQRSDSQGLARLNRRAMGFLNERLESWGENFPSLKGRVTEVKWREWALDKIWHAFWLGPEEGWREVLPLYVAALGFNPPLTQEINQLINFFEELGALDQASRPKILWLQQAAGQGTGRREALEGIKMWELQSNGFRLKMPLFAKELSSLLESNLDHPAI